KSITQVSQAKFMGSVKGTGCASDWTVTNTSFTSFGTQTGCSYALQGSAQQPSTNIPAIKFASLPAGNYHIIYEGKWTSQNTGVLAQLQLSDGTNVSPEVPSDVSSTTSGHSNNASFSMN